MPNWKKVVTSGSDAYLNTLDTTHIKINNTSSLRESNSGNLLYLGNDADWVGIEYGRVVGTSHKFNGEEIFIPEIPVNDNGGTNVLTIDSSTGRIIATGSYGNAGSAGVGTLQQVTAQGSETNISITSSATVALSASGHISASQIHLDNFVERVGAAGTYFGFAGSNKYVVFTSNNKRLEVVNAGAVITGSLKVSSHVSASNIYVTSSGGSATVNVVNRTDISPANTAPGQFRIEGDGYTLYNALDSTAAYIGHNSDLRDLILQTNETDRLTIDGSTGNVGVMADISASNVTASIYDSPGVGASYGYHVDSTASLAKKNDELQVGVSTDWSGARYNQSATQTNTFIGIMKLSQVANATSSAGTNVLTINSGTGQVYMTGSYSSGGSPGGSNKAVQFNNNGSFDGNSGFEYDTANKTIDLQGASGFTIDAAVSNGALNIISNNDIINEVTGDFDVKLGESSQFRIYQVNSGNIRMKVDQFGDITMEESLAVGPTISPSGTAGRIDAENDVVAFSTSDERLKKYIKPIPNALDKVSQIRGVEFDWKATDQKTRDEVHSFEGHDVGVLAQEVEKVLPEVVTTRNSGYKAVKYEKIVPLLIESIKELKAEIEELKKNK